MDEKNLMNDLLSSQKFLTSAYNLAITESASDQLRRDFLNIYQEEQNNLKTLFDVMHARGWYPLDTASPQDVAKVRQQFQGQAGGETAGMRF